MRALLRATMCNPVTHGRETLTCLVSIYGAVIGTIIMIIILTKDCGSVEDLLYIAAGGYQDQLALIVDLSHSPKPFEVCTNSPESGDPCHGLARGDECFVGEFYLLEPNHCNQCCHRLYADDSCAGNVCECYTNSGCIMTGV